jgi:Raf kinase inhibitor-like YbhB/YbcL family protein
MGRILILLVGAVLIFVLAFIVFRKSSGGGEEEVEDNNFDGVMTITSDVFEAGGLIPAKYTCDGENVSPPLAFAGVPGGTESLTLIVDDPDVPKSIRPDGMWTHWLVWNMPVNMSAIAEGGVPNGVIGQNSGGNKQYSGPCPPDREHRYFFKLFALDTILDLDANSVGKADLERAMDGHILAEAQLMGRYARK